jgi:hypothetical protein
MPWRIWKHVLTCVLHLMDPILNKNTEKIPTFFLSFYCLSPRTFGPHCVLPNNSNSTDLCITQLCIMPVHIRGVHSVLFCNPIINLGRNYLRPILIFVNIILVLLFKPKRKFWWSLKIYVCQPVTVEKGRHVLSCNRLGLFTHHA